MPPSCTEANLLIDVESRFALSLILSTKPWEHPLEHLAWSSAVNVAWYLVVTFT